MASFRTGKAFISLPILLLLLFVISLTYQFYQHQADQRQWQYQTQQAKTTELIWQAFEFNLLSGLTVSQAKDSPCETFCLLDVNDFAIDSGSNQYQYDGETLLWVFEKEGHLSRYYRLCAKRVLTLSIQCWWLKEAGNGQLYWFANLPIRH